MDGEVISVFVLDTGEERRNGIDPLLLFPPTSSSSDEELDEWNRVRDATSQSC